MLKIGIIGATGYTGIELIRLLAQHPEAELAYASTETYADKMLSAVYPHLQGLTDIVGQKLDANDITATCDVIFCALPHGHAMKIVPQLLAAGKKVIDLGADFRLHDAKVYEAWYKEPHVAANLLAQAVYGLPEAGYRAQIQKAQLIANPGCYPTASILASLPLIKNKIVALDQCIFDAKSGVSGAGRGMQQHLHFCEMNDNFSAYQVGGQHRHTPEIEQALSHLASSELTIQFTPHLLPITRGMLVTCYFKLNKKLSLDDIYALYQEAYQDEPFVRLCAPGVVPTVKQVVGSNFCNLGITLDERTGRVIVVSVLDNLLKGASAQAIQNMNIICQLPESLGLQQFPTYL
jgi:N-acetyl-gamma-glutamyl-phosphate reductase